MLSPNESHEPAQPPAGPPPAMAGQRALSKRPLGLERSQTISRQQSQDGDPKRSQAGLRSISVAIWEIDPMAWDQPRPG